MWNHIQVIIDLCKGKISCFAALSAATGYVLAAPEINRKLLVLLGGVLLLASGCCALNQYQEKDIDALMRRTRARPIPSKRISPSRALFMTMAFIGVSFIVLSRLGNLSVLMVGLFALIWYNGVYTLLKRRTPWAAIPGALTGALAPCMGWLAGGGSPQNPLIWSVGVLFFFWQIPHFWLVLLRNGEDFEKAGLPSLTTTFSRGQLSRITLVWTVALAVVSLMVPLYGPVSSAVFFLLGAAGVWLCWNGVVCFKNNRQQRAYSRSFRVINVYMLVVLGSLAAGGIFRGMSGSF